MEDYNDFLKRISYKQADLQIGDGYFIPDGRVYQKVNPDNTFKPFYGDTVVFDLDSRTKTRITKIIEKLYKSVPECFCQMLDKSTLHMTLHDLSASDNLDSISSEVFNNEIRLLQAVRNKPIEPQAIKMKTNFIINMVSTSLVLALVPADETEWDKLQTLYDLVNEVKICPYPYFIVGFNYLFRDIATEIYYLTPILKNYPISWVSSFILTMVESIIGTLICEKIRLIFHSKTDK